MAEKAFIERRMNRNWYDFFCDSRTGKYQESKTFSVLGKTGLLGWWSWKCYNGDDYEWMWWLIACVLTAHAMFTTLISAKFGGVAIPEPKSTTTTTATAEIVTTTKGKK